MKDESNDDNGKFKNDDPFFKVDNSLSSSGMLFTGKEASERLLIRNSNDFFPFFISRVH